jgi:hypothetical protein
VQKRTFERLINTRPVLGRYTASLTRAETPRELNLKTRKSGINCGYQNDESPPATAKSSVSTVPPTDGLWKTGTTGVTGQRLPVYCFLGSLKCLPTYRRKHRVYVVKKRKHKQQQLLKDPFLLILKKQ